MKAVKPLYYRHRFPGAVISHAVRLYFRFQLSLRDIEELLLERGVVVTYETIRRWCAKFGPAFAERAKQVRPGPGTTWHLDETLILSANCQALPQTVFGARVAKRVTRVVARGRPSSQCTMRDMFIATAVHTCCSPVLDSPI